MPIAGNTVTLMQMEGSALHIDSDEAKIQMEEMGEIGLYLLYIIVTVVPK